MAFDRDELTPIEALCLWLGTLRRWSPLLRLLACIALAFVALGLAGMLARGLARLGGH